MALASLALVTSCKRAPTSVDAGPIASASASVDGALTLENASAERLWVEARDADPLELARLADALGADGLAAIAGDPAKDAGDRASAVRALAYVDDPTPALETLARLAGSGGTLGDEALETLLDVAPRRAPIEEAEPTAWRSCAQGLLVVAPTVRDAARRRLLVRTLDALADRGAIDPASVPAP
ncbi:MAG: hypothetical protein NVSMB47_20230 [Polyangiales bacterium]